MQQTVLYHLELQLPYGADDFASVELIGEQLRHTFVHELTNPFVKLFGFHGVGVLNVFEHFGRERGEALEMDGLAGGERVAYLEVARVGDTGLYRRGMPRRPRFFLGHERRWGGKTHLLVRTDMPVVDIALKFAGAHLYEGDARAMIGVHVGVNLEHKAGERVLRRLDEALLRLDRAGGQELSLRNSRAVPSLRMC